MASEAPKRFLSGLLTKVSESPPSDPNSYFNYNLECLKLNINLETKASCSYEAALKMGFLLAEARFLADSEEDAAIMITVENKTSSTKEEYKVTMSAGNESYPLVTLKRFIKFEGAAGGEDQADMSRQNNSTQSQDQNGSFDPLASIADVTLVIETLIQFLGFSTFRPLQKEAILASLAGKNVLTVLSTGGGKTLLFMSPAVIEMKLTVVVCPIKSLNDDQLGCCENFSIPVCKFTGDVCLEQQQEQLVRLEDFKLMFSTPELLAEGPLRVKVDLLLEKGEISCVVFDKAHTISTWGNSFRPVYRTVCEELAKVNCPKLATVPL